MNSNNKKLLSLNRLSLFIFILLLFFSFIHVFKGPLNQNKIKSKAIAVHGNLNSFSNVKEFPSYTEEIQPTKAPVDVSKMRVLPGGHSIGIHLETLGVLVVGHHAVQSKEENIFPAKEANIKIGDIILEVNNREIQTISDIKPLIEKAGKNNQSLELKLQRNDQTLSTSIQPVMDHKENQFSIGLYIRDTAAGIGTLSFIDPKSKRYGALGHVISDIDTKKPIPIKGGKILSSSVTRVQKGTRDIPGEKRAEFSLSDEPLGTIFKNSPYGIFGTIEKLPPTKKYNEPLKVGLSKDVKEGPAKILTVVNGDEIKEYTIEIISNKVQDTPSTKGMIIKVTDEELINKTGGIVQGMSGSPIIQDEKIIGAVTHVFLNDPTTGYAVHIEWMLQDANTFVEKQQLEAS